MATRAAWLRGSVAGLLAALVLGRWLVVTVAESLWAESLGSAEGYRQIRELQTWLFAAAFTVAAVWFLGNLYLVYRSIGSVHVPRRVGNIEILETLPRHYIILGFVAVGIALAVAVSHNAGSWWTAWALAGVEPPAGPTDPVLGHPVSFYLYELPWRRSMHRYATLLAGLALLVVGALYSAVGVVRWKKRRLEVNAIGRAHLAVVAAAFALVLFWGYRLEPAEYVGGLHNVPLDTVLVDIRLPVARGLSALALLACGASLFWIWVPRVLLVGISWGILAVGSFVGHYIAPAIAGSAREPDEQVIPEVAVPAPSLVELAYGVRKTVESVIPSAGGADTPNPDDLRVAPIWDVIAIDAFLERAGSIAVHERFVNPSIQLIDPSGPRPHPVYVVARGVDLTKAADSGATVDWGSVHAGDFVASQGVLVLDATRASPSGLPLFVPSLSRVDSVVEEVVDLGLPSDRWYFGPNVADYASVAANEPVLGVDPGGLFRRLALAWVLQSPRILRRSNVADTSRLVWDRDVVGRLEQYAPFLDFGNPYPVISGDRMRWLSVGYIVADAFPGVPTAEWRGDRIRYMHAGAVGVVDAITGETNLYAFREPGMVMQGWIDLLPSLVQPFDAMSEELAASIRYPVELFDVQRDVVSAAGLDAVPDADRASAFYEPTWWVGPAIGDSLVRLRRVAVDEVGTPPAVRHVLVGTMGRGGPAFSIVGVDSTVQMLGPTQLVRRFIPLRDATADFHGAMRAVPLMDGLVVLQASYRVPTEDGAVLELRGVTLARGGAVGAGTTLAEAIERLGSEVPAPVRSGSWAEARRWFQRLDAARQSGDWRAFGEAYDALRRLFVPVDSLP